MVKRRKKRRLGQASICVCGGPTIYATCCKPYHKGDALPETPVDLMKSRYSAYSLGLIDYVIETTDPEGSAWEADEARWRASIADFGHSFEFTGVEILERHTDADEGIVRFRAGLRAGGVDESFEETSRFRRVDGRWLYRAGDVAEP